MTPEENAQLVELLKNVVRGVVKEELEPLQNQVKGIDEALGRIEEKQDSAEEANKAQRRDIAEIRKALERQHSI